MHTELKQKTFYFMDWVAYWQGWYCCSSPSTNVLHGQCDQMLESKVAKYPPWVAQKIAKAVCISKVTLSKYHQEVAKYLDNFWKNTICHQNFQKSPNLVTLFMAYLF